MFAGGEGKEDRQEVEESVTCCLDQDVSPISSRHASGNQKCCHTFQHPCSCQRSQDRLENFRNHIDELVKQAAFWTFIFSFDFAAAVQSADRIHGRIHIRYVVPDDDLVLAAAFDDRYDAFTFFQVFRIRLAFVDQFETQTGDAVGQAADVFFAADMSQNVFCQFFIFHVISLFFCYFFNKKT